MIDPSFPCAQDCQGCGSAIFGVRPELGFDSLDQEIAARKYQLLEGSLMALWNSCW